MIRPKALKKSDKIALISTARKIKKEDLSFAINTIEGWGFSIDFGNNLFAENNQFAGTDQQRTDDLQRALDNPEIKAVICVRGGYGTVRIIDNIDFSNFIKTPKWICGYSDITVLHAHVQQNFGIETLHSTMPINFSTNSKEALESLKNVLFGEQLSYSINPAPLNRIGTCEGEIIGGNLSILYSILGSKSSANTKNKILFIEDLDEYLYHVDRMMMNLKRNGLLSNLAGLIVGGMTSMNDNTIAFGQTAIEIIKQSVNEYEYPVCFHFPSGHIDDNRSLILGRKAKFEVGRSNVKLDFTF